MGNNSYSLTISIYIHCDIHENMEVSLIFISIHNRSYKQNISPLIIIYFLSSTALHISQLEAPLFFSTINIPILITMNNNISQIDPNQNYPKCNRHNNYHLKNFRFFKFGEEKQAQQSQTIYWLALSFKYVQQEFDILFRQSISYQLCALLYNIQLIKYLIYNKVNAQFLNKQKIVRQFVFYEIQRKYQYKHLSYTQLLYIWLQELIKIKNYQIQLDQARKFDSKIFYFLTSLLILIFFFFPNSFESFLLIIKTSFINFIPSVYMDQTFNSLISRSTFKQQLKKADPWDVIPVKNFKYARQTTQVHLGKRQAQQLINFQKFQNLQTVWLNDNRLTNLEGLQSNFRIKNLYLQKNKIKSIKGVIQKLKHLQTLILYDNELRDLDNVLGSIKTLTSLRHLQLFQNPIAEEPNYKLRVLSQLPKLEIFDRHKVSQQQKDKAIKFMRN